MKLDGVKLVTGTGGSDKPRLPQPYKMRNRAQGGGSVLIVNFLRYFIRGALVEKLEDGGHHDTPHANRRSWT